MEALKACIEQGGQRKSFDMVQQMKKRGVDIQFIAEVSGLTTEEIEKL